MEDVTSHNWGPYRSPPLPAILTPEPRPFQGMVMSPGVRTGIDHYNIILYNTNIYIYTYVRVPDFMMEWPCNPYLPYNLTMAPMFSWLWVLWDVFRGCTLCHMDPHGFTCGLRGLVTSRGTPVMNWCELSRGLTLGAQMAQNIPKLSQLLQVPSGDLGLQPLWPLSEGFGGADAGCGHVSPARNGISNQSGKNVYVCVFCDNRRGCLHIRKWICTKKM